MHAPVGPEHFLLSWCQERQCRGPLAFKLRARMLLAVVTSHLLRDAVVILKCDWWDLVLYAASALVLLF